MGAKHPLHSMCSYLGCFPASVPRKILKDHVPMGATVLDPFCGSGTTLLESALLGYPSIGIDLNPLAVAVSRAKTRSVSLEDVNDRLFALSREYNGADIDHLRDGIKLIFHPRTLAQLVFLRDALDPRDTVDAFIQGTVLGIMHGKHKKGGTDTAYLSIDMPNTFSMSPEYVRGFVAKHDLKQLPVDVFGKLRQRASWLLREGSAPATPLRVLEGDAVQLPTLLRRAEVSSVDAIVTSPPYLGVLRYGAFNWIRLWFLNHEPAPVDRMLDSTNSLDRYLSFMSSFLSSAGEIVRPGGTVALVIGDVVDSGNHLQLANRVWEELVGLVPFEKRSIRSDKFDATVKTTRIWGDDKKGRATPMDRVLVLQRIPQTKRKARSSAPLTRKVRSAAVSPRRVRTRRTDTRA